MGREPGDLPGTELCSSMSCSSSWFRVHPVPTAPQPLVFGDLGEQVLPGDTGPGILPGKLNMCSLEKQQTSASALWWHAGHVEHTWEHFLAFMLGPAPVGCGSGLRGTYCSFFIYSLSASLQCSPSCPFLGRQLRITENQKTNHSF